MKAIYLSLLILLTPFLLFSQIPTGHLQLWLKADANVTHTTTVSAWNDCSGNNNNATQATANKQPGFVASYTDLNNMPAINFDGTNDELLGTTISNFNNNSFSVFIVARNNTLPTTGSARGMFSVGAYNSGGFELMRASAGYFGYYQKTSNFNSGNSEDCSPSGSPFRLYTATKQINTISKLYVNSAFRSSSTLANIISSFTNSAYKVGYFSVSPYYWNGNIAEIIVYDTLLTDSNRINVETYLMDKYTPVFSLGNDIQIDYGFCDTTLSIGPGFTNILWSTGETTSSINVTTTGTYFVQANDNFGRLRQDTIHVTFPTLSLTNSTICLGDSAHYTINLAGDYSYLWSNSSTASELYLSQEANYWVQITDTNACTFTKNFSVSVDSFANQISLGNDTSLCLGNTIQLVQGESLCSNFNWQPGGNTLPIQTVSESGWYKLYVTNSFGCNAIDSVYVNIQGVAPTPVFTVENFCFNDSTQFNDFSFDQDSIANYTWVFNNNDTLYSQNPKYLFDNTGNQTIKLILESFSGCKKDSTALIVIRELPQVSFSYLTVCSNVPMEFIPDVIVPVGSNIVAYHWFVDNNPVGDTEILTYSFTGSGEFLVKLIVDIDNACSGSYEHSVSVESNYPDPLYISLVSPSDGYMLSSQNVVFKWNIADNALFYEIILAEDDAFQNIFFSESHLIQNNYSYYIPDGHDTIYWKVIAYNPCNIPLSSETYQILNFEPAWIQNLKLWINAENVEIINGKVAQCYDLSGNSFNLTQETEAKRPVVVENQIAGLPIIRFNGTSNFMTTNFGQTFTQPNTIFLIFKISDAATRYVYDGIDAFHALRYNSGELQMRVGSSDFGYVRSAPTGFLSSMQVFNTTNSKLFENGQLKNSGTLSAGGLSGFKLGTYYTEGNYYFKGDVAEIILFNSVLSDSEIHDVRQYLSNKYSQPVSLGYDIRIPYGFCDTAIVNAYKPWFSSYQWSTGETDSIIHVNRSGVYSVTVTDIFGFQSSDDIRVFYPEVNQINDTVVCLGQQVIWDVQINGAYSYQWMGSSQTTQTINIDAPGDYAAFISDTTGCTFFSDTIHFDFDYYQINASIGPNDTSLCIGNSLSLISEAEQTVAYLWNSGNATNHINIDAPGEYSLIATNQRNCIAYDTISVSVHGTAPTPIFTAENLCSGQATQFYNSSFDPDSIQYYTWVFNFTDTLYSQNPQFIFPNPGNYNVQLILESFSGCKNDSAANLNISEPPQVNFSYLTVCSNVPMEFIPDVIVPVGSNIVAYHWFVDNNPVGDTEILTYSFTGSGEFLVKLIVDIDNACSGSYEHNVSVESNYPDPLYISLVSPSDGYMRSSQNVVFKWNIADNALFYEIILAEDDAFQNIFFSESNLIQNNYSYSIPDGHDTIYWKVIAYNPCNIPLSSETYQILNFDPAWIQNLKLWINAENVEIINGKVAQCYDLSGNSFNLTQETEAKRPVVVENQIAGLPVIRFNGTSNFMTTNFGQTFSQPSTFFVIFKLDDASIRYVYDGINSFNALRYVGGEMEMRVSSTTLGYTRPAPFGYILSSQIFNGTNSQIYENGQLKKSGTLPSNTLSGLTLGTYYTTGNYYFKGDIAELIYFNKSLSIDETNDVRQYLSNKYSQPVSLGYDIRIPYGFCDTAIVNAYKPWFSSYQWSTGETDSIIHVNRSGVYSVTVTDIFGFQSSDDIRVFYPDVNQINDTVVCLGQQVIWDVQINGAYSYQWLGSTQTTQAINIDAPGDYAAFISDTIGCTFFSDTIHFDFDYYQINASIGPNDTSLCIGNSLSLISEAEQTVAYLWNNGNTTNHINIDAPGEYSLIATNQRNCIAYDTISVSVHGTAPTPIFTADNLCSGQATQFYNSSFDPDSIQYYTWVFNFTDTLYSQNPQFIFPNPGNYNVQLILESFSGCKNDSAANLNISEPPQVNFSYLTVCSNVPMEFIPDVIVPVGSNIVAYHWFVDNNPVGDTEILTYSFTGSGEFLVKLIVDIDNACSGSYEHNVSVESNYPDPLYISLVSPSDGYMRSSQNVVFKWNIADNALFYEIILAEDDAFQNIFFSESNLIQNNYSYSIPDGHDTIYWKVIAYNPCNIPLSSETYQILNFEPAWIQNLKLWINAENVEIINGKVAQCYDLSGNSFNLTQETEAKRPVVVENQIAGLPIIRFNGTSNFMTTNFGQTFSQPNTIFLIFKISDAATRYVYDGIDAFHALRYNSGELQMRVGSSDFGYVRSAPTGFLSSMQVFNTTNSKLFENGQLKNSGTLTAGGLSGFKLGTYYTEGNYYFKGDVAEVILFNSVLSDSEIHDVRQYLSNKYSQPVCLGYDIRIPYGFCDTAIVNAYKPWFSSYQWSTGETDSIIHVNRSGIYSVTVTDIFGFQSSDDIRVFYPEVNQINDTVVCLGQQVIWDVQINGAYSYQWLGSTQTTQAINIDAPGDYAAFISDTTGCTFFSDTIHFDFDYYQINASIGPNDTLLCSGNRLMLVTNADETETYSWSTGSTEPEIILSESGEYSVSVVNNRGCMAVDTIQVDIIGVAPVAVFTTNGHCAENTVYFTDASVSTDGDIISWSWQIDGETVANTTNMEYVFPNYGSYNVRLSVSTDVGCYEYTDVPVLISPLPVISFSPDYFCQNSDMELISTSFVPTGNISENTWYIEDSIYTSSVVYHRFTEEGINFVKLISISDMLCVDSVTREIIIRNAELPVFEAKNTCEGETVFFVNSTPYNSINTPSGWLWDFGDGESSSQSNPDHIYTSTGLFDVVLTINYLNGCQVHNSNQISVYRNPIVEFDNLDACVLSHYSPFLDITSYDGEIASYNWELVDSAVQISDLEYPAFYLHDAGYFLLSVEVETNYGCKKNVADTLVVHENPSVSFTVSQTWGSIPLEIEFNNLSEGAYSYLWDFGDGNFSDDTNPIHTYPDSGVYNITLIGFSEYYCADTSYFQIKSIIPQMEVVLFDLRTKMVDNYLQTSVYVINNGNLPVYNLELLLNTGSGSIYRERIDYVGLGEVIDYVFKSEIYYADGIMPEVVCVEALVPPYETFEDINPDNNILCSTDVEKLTVFKPYPNPTKSLVYLEFMISDETDISIEIISIIGNILFKHEFTDFSGYKKMQIDVSDYAAGLYFLRVSSPNESRNFKLEIE